MVLLTMTAAAVEALERLPPLRTEAEDDSSKAGQPAAKDEPSLTNPGIGNPISHGQLVDLWNRLREGSEHSTSLESLLRGARVYVPPPPPKPEKSKEYLALMARLRREEEARAYERMLNPPAPITTFNPASRSFTEANRPLTAADLGDEEVTYNDIHRQLVLLINFLVSIAGVAGTLWVAARWWSTPARLFLTMGGSIVVAIAEVVVYQAYVWKMGEAKKGQVKAKEVREVGRTWVVGDGGGKAEGKEAVMIPQAEVDGSDVVRRRNVPAKDENL
ncbi:hypothetical protein NLU13_8733 [Sarocladium strictum]|uniref:Endoplasmic reticulum-based factor for assembly of V-ATPase-domain-containing protein n=1 Tax=Sarocladium strictum TaxID=5046 RepID=A0AA39L5A4_SARSR|nr:hypothetical protein NLU13_8733 [Sarocladium strictum]